MWITQRFRTIAVFPINWERLDAGVFTSMLPATKRKSRTSATRETDVISERKHCSRKRRHTQVDFRTRRKCADKTQTIARKRWHSARKRKRSNVRSTCGRLNSIMIYHMKCIVRYMVLRVLSKYWFERWFGGNISAPKLGCVKQAWIP